MTIGKGLFARLSQRELLTPYLEKAMLDDKWPNSYQVTVDSSPYTGFADGWFHPSTHCFSDERFLQMSVDPRYKDRLVPERMSLQSRMTIAMGSALHAVVQTQFLIAGMIREEDIEVSLVNEEVHGRGSMDFRIYHPNGKAYAVDIKTQNSRGFDMEHYPKKEWVGQLNCYMDWAGLDEAIVLVLESGFPYRFKEHHFSKDEQLLDEIYGRWTRVLEAVERGDEIREFCCTPATPSKGCPAWYICWGEGD